MVVHLNYYIKNKAFNQDSRETQSSFKAASVLRCEIRCSISNVICAVNFSNYSAEWVDLLTQKENQGTRLEPEILTGIHTL